MESVGQSSCRRFAHDPKNVEASDLSSISSSSSLRIIEMGRDCYNSLVDSLAQVGFGRLLHLEEHHGREFLGEECFGLSFVLHSNLWITFGYNNQ